MPLIRALGGDAYTNSTSFDAHPDWSAPSSFPNPNAQLQSFLPVPEVGEKWITAGVTGGNPMFADAVPMVNFEFEISKAFRTVGTPGLVGNGLFNIILTGSTGGGGFATINVSYNTAGDIEIQGVGYALTTVASAVLQPDENYYITFRHRRQSGLGVLDGVTEIYLNDQLIHSVTNLDGGLLERSSTWTSIFLDPRAQSNKWWKNITVFDQWTQADGVAPDILNVDDAGGFTETTSVVPLSYYVNVPSNGRYLNSPIVMI